MNEGGIRKIAEKDGCRVVAMKKPVMGMTHTVVREGSTGRVVVRLPQVWAVAQEQSASRKQNAEGKQAQTFRQPATPEPYTYAAGWPREELAFYRKYTEALLRRYQALERASGRVPSLMGREMFRGAASHYRMTGFDDMVIFRTDVERCLKTLRADEQRILRRIAIQEYTQGEAAGLLGLSLRGCVMQYGRALDRLTRVLLDRGLLQPLGGCQG